MSMNECRLTTIRLTGSDRTACTVRPESVAAIMTPADVAAVGVALDAALAGGQAHGLAVAAQEPVGDRVVARRVVFGDGEQAVVVVDAAAVT